MNTKRLRKLFTCDGKRKMNDQQEWSLQYLEGITLYHPYYDSAVRIDYLIDAMDKFGLGDVDKIFNFNLILCHLKQLETGTFWGHVLEDCLPDCFRYHYMSLTEDQLFANIYSWWCYRTTLNKVIFDVVNFESLAKAEDEETSYAKYLPETVNGVSTIYLKAATRLIKGKSVEINLLKNEMNAESAVLKIVYPTSMVRTYLMTKTNHFVCADNITEALQSVLCNLPDFLCGADFRTVLEYIQNNKLI